MTTFAESPYHPLAPDVWSVADGQASSSYQRAIETIQAETDILGDRLCRDLAARALFATVADQSGRNNRYMELSELAQSIPDSESENVYYYMRGDKSPDEMVDFLYSHPNLRAAEIARLTHVNNWDVREVIDQPVRESLDRAPLDTQRVATMPYYKIKMFDPEGAIVERKRVVRKHFGGQVLTVIRNSLLIDYHDATLPDEVYGYVRSEHVKINDRDKDYDYSQESDFLKGALEDHMRDRQFEDKPTWAVPLLTTYYSTLSEHRHRDGVDLAKYEDAA